MIFTAEHIRSVIDNWKPEWEQLNLSSVVVKFGADLSGADLYGADLSGADLRDADLRGADLRGADLRGADLSGANLSGANLSGANLRGANLGDADLRDADLRGTNLSGVTGLLDSVSYLRDHFEARPDGYVVYKTFSKVYPPRSDWEIRPGSVLFEVCNSLQTVDCGSGINVATLHWQNKNNPGAEIWKCLIRWQWQAGIVVPYNTDGKIRTTYLELIEIIHE